MDVVTLRQLRYLTALAEHRHFGRAAEACAISQPALSMQIRELEKTLNVQVVERRPGDIVLTEAGLEIARRGETILTSARDLVDFARHQGRLLSGRLRFGVIPTLAPYVLPKILPALQDKYPLLRMEIRETQTRTLLDELGRGALDVVMLALPVDAAEIETTPLFTDEFLLAVPAAEAWPDRARVTSSDLDQQRLILLEEGHCLRDQALAYCTTARRDQTVSLGATSLATVMQMVANGYGVTLLPRIAVDVEARDRRIKLLPFVKPVPGRTIGLAWRKTSPRVADFQVLRRLLREAVGGRMKK
jgi:LysR family hydrogen peroxide-inducible transcriptional activator